MHIASVPLLFSWHTASELTLAREPWKVQDPLYCVEADNHSWPPSDDKKVVPFRLGEEVRWKLVD